MHYTQLKTVKCVPSVCLDLDRCSLSQFYDRMKVLLLTAKVLQWQVKFRQFSSLLLCWCCLRWLEAVCSELRNPLNFQCSAGHTWCPKLTPPNNSCCNFNNLIKFANLSCSARPEAPSRNCSSDSFFSFGFSHVEFHTYRTQTGSRQGPF